MSNIQVRPQIQLPAEIASQLAALGVGADDLDSGVSSGFPVMSIRGAKWRIAEGGEERPIYIPGTTDLAPAIRVVLLRSNPAVSKTFYASKFEEGSDAAPDCYSSDGIAPAADSPKPQATSCAACPHNVWGSKMTDAGKKTKACADVRRTAILPADDLDYSPILLRVPAASLGDLADYGRALKKRGIPYMAVVTKLSFDPDASYPKINFTYERVLSGEELMKVAEKIKEPVIEDILGLRGAPAAASTPVPASNPVPPVQQPVTPPPTEQPIQVQPEQKAETKPKATKAKGFGAAPEQPASSPAQQTAAAAAATTAVPEPAGDILASLNASLAGLKL
jgi:hypothetical protein